MGYSQIAAVDLGSNSFRLEIGRVVDDQIYPLDSLKESVRLASGLNKERILDEAAQQRALDTLARFGERLRGFNPDAVRAVATNTLRVASNARAFLPRLEAALGFPIEIIAGREEARLIYIGVAHSLPQNSSDKRLVVDIGGGSTEFIIGKQIEPLAMESLFMGCVSFSQQYFPEGKVDRKRFADAEAAAAGEIQLISEAYKHLGWSEAVGSSGTARAIADLLESNELNPDNVTGITAQGLEKLKSLLIRAGSAENMRLSGLRADRTPVFAGGLAIMCAIFAELGLERMIYSDGALRLGVLYDQLGRYQHNDMREVTVQQFMRRYQVDARQAARVEKMSLELLGQIISPDAPENESEFNFLRWAASLHEVGISISPSGFHKHGAYIIGNADMPGFSRKDQERLSLLLLGQRGKLDKLPWMPPSDPLWRVLFCLRLSTIFNRSRSDHPSPKALLKQVPGGFVLEVPAKWIAANPLTAAALSNGVHYWQSVGMNLRIKRRTVASGD